MRTLDELKRLLTDRRITQISEVTGIHRNTLARIRDGRQPNPTYYVMAKLDAYFDGQGARHE
jgi:transcriptional regulator with XRE-family HTH domain